MQPYLSKMPNRQINGTATTSRRSRPEQNYRVLRPKAKAARLLRSLGSRLRRPHSASCEDPDAQNWGNTIPPPVVAPQNQQPQGHYLSDATSQTPPLGPPNTDLYEQSRFAWSYEVETKSVILRISTIPNDFLGNSGEDQWPRPLKVCHTDYKGVSALLDNAEAALGGGAVHKLKAEEVLALEEKVYNGAYNEAMAREEFLQVWPSAFGWDEGFEGHLKRSRILEEKARTAQKQGLAAYQK